MKLIKTNRLIIREKLLSRAFSIILICSMTVGICMSQENDAKPLPLPVCLDGKAVFINKYGSIILKTPFDFDDIFYFSDGLASFRENDKYGFIDEIGKVVIKPTFESVSMFSEGFTSFSIKGKCGFIDKTGKIVIQPQYDLCEEFANGFARVSFENGIGKYYDDRFKIKYELPKYKVGFIDKTGKMIIGKRQEKSIGKFDEAKDFSEGLAAVKVSDKWGYVNEKDKIVIRFRFEKVENFSEGLAPATIDGEKWGFIDQTGKFVIKPQFTEADSFSEGLAAISTYEKGFSYTEFIDRTGNTVVKIPFLFFSPGKFGGFHDGIASVVSVGAKSSVGVKKDGFTNYLIDNTGKTIFQEDNIAILPLKDGISSIQKNYKYSYIDKTGKYIWNAEEQNKQKPSKCNELPTWVKKKQS